jgi:hypothetical protein
MKAAPAVSRLVHALYFGAEGLDGACATCCRVTQERLKALFAEYGRIAIWTYLALFVLVFVAFALAISLGFEIESARGGAGLLGASYLATKVSQPLRIFATLLLTPLLARLFRRRKEQPGGSSERPSGDLDTGSR